MTFTYDEAKQFLIEHLSHDADLHIAGKYSELGEGFETYDQNLLRSNDERFVKLYISLHFWDGWTDARNHDWYYYKGIGQNDWPELARIIIQNISNEQEITNQIVLKYFRLQNRRGILERFGLKIKWLHNTGV
jgi:hypothetical protein